MCTQKTWTENNHKILVKIQIDNKINQSNSQIRHNKINQSNELFEYFYIFHQLRQPTHNVSPTNWFK